VMGENRGMRESGQCEVRWRGKSEQQLTSTPLGKMMSASARSRGTPHLASLPMPHTQVPSNRILFIVWYKRRCFLFYG